MRRLPEKNTDRHDLDAKDVPPRPTLPPADPGDPELTSQLVARPVRSGGLESVHYFA
jgi:hypothetical protein